ncbi:MULTISPECIES: helix-turn-helix domain-containing protein [Bacillales]|uniref:Helix-turn-helix transcriptional regulator n=1 Tax=Paenibacillus agri TaxID=2744309 RepID=A0A850ENA6_9BACL|nr:MULTISPECIES: helix-turn-helix domain-containing protein [Bacillales]NUU60062.1 helix-turn-helix transcriptional regulator [Paenibacillus agri]OBZ11585.1 HxlR family transcriptional regulator [Bacillus sp. FJAT-27264]
MKATDLCPRLQKSMDIMGKRWTGLIIYQLLHGPQRFSTIEASLPVSGRLLSERLKDLEQEGIVLREVFPETPVRIQYSLTEKGRALESVIRDLQQWSEDWIEPGECQS